MIFSILFNVLVRKNSDRLKKKKKMSHNAEASDNAIVINSRNEIKQLSTAQNENEVSKVMIVWISLQKIEWVEGAE